MEKYAPQLPELLPSLEGSSEICYALNSQEDLVYCNRSWDAFAIQNGGAACLTPNVLGKNLWEVVPSELKEFFVNGFNVARSSGFWEHDFECPSPAEVRTYRMRALPLEGDGLLIRNALLHSHPSSQITADLDRFRDSHGIFHLCSHCRKANILGTNEWAFVPQLLAAKNLRISHGLCEVCLRYHYGRLLSHSESSSSR
jgi:hypothetical protein